MSPRPGFALIFAMWASLALALIGTVLLHRLRDEADHNAALLRDVRARAADEAATSLAVLALLDPSPPLRARVDGVAARIAAAPIGANGAMPGPYLISIQDQNGLVDLNRAAPATLRRLFIAAGSDAITADALARSVLDARAPGLAAVDALRLLPGIEPDLFARLAPALTVFAGSDTINPQTAPALALRAAGLDEDAADAMIARRDEHPPAGLSGLPLAGGIIDPAIAPTGWVFAVRVRRLDAPAPMRETILRLTGNPARPVLFLAEQRLP